MLRSPLFLLLVAGSTIGCGGLLGLDDSAPGSKSEAEPDSGVTRPRTEDVRPIAIGASCSKLVPTPFAKIETTFGRSKPVLGPCGDVLYDTPSSAVVLRRPDGSEVTLNSNGPMPVAGDFGTGGGFDVSGRWIAFSDGASQRVVLRDLTNGETFHASGRIGFGYDAAKRESVPFACTENGIETFDGKGFSLVGGTSGLGCLRRSEFGGTLLAQHPLSHSLVVVDLIGRRVQKLAIEYRDDMPEGRADALILSADGRVILYEKRTSSPSGDTWVADTSEPVQVIATRDGHTIDAFDGNLPDTVSGSDFAEARRGHALALTGRNGGGLYLVDTWGERAERRTEHFSRFLDNGALIAFADRGAGESSLVRIDHASATPNDIVPAGRISGAAVSASGKTAVWTTTEGCVKNSSGSCVGSIESVLRTGATMPLFTAYDRLYDGIVWDDGSALFGNLTVWKDGQPPPNAEANALPLEESSAWILAADGSRIDLGGGDRDIAVVEVSDHQLLVLDGEANRKGAVVSLLDRSSPRYRREVATVSGFPEVSAIPERAIALVTAGNAAERVVYVGSTK